MLAMTALWPARGSSSQAAVRAPADVEKKKKKKKTAHFVVGVVVAAARDVAAAAAEAGQPGQPAQGDEAWPVNVQLLVLMMM